MMAKQVRTPLDTGALVRSASKEQNLRQDQLAGVSGVGVRLIVDLEAGNPTAQVGKVLHVLQMLGCSVEIMDPGERRWLFGHTSKAMFHAAAESKSPSILSRGIR